jgi:hypothetical protein
MMCLHALPVCLMSLWQGVAVVVDKPSGCTSERLAKQVPPPPPCASSPRTHPRSCARCSTWWPRGQATPCARCRASTLRPAAAWCNGRGARDRQDQPLILSQVLPLCAAAEAALTAQFKNHRVLKTYIALCRGVAPDHGRINVRLKTISTVTRHFAVPHPGGKDAVTEFKRIALLQQPSPSAGHNVADASSSSSSSSSSYSLLLVTPITGRMHQIRAHLNHIGHPLDGDGRCVL